MSELEKTFQSLHLQLEEYAGVSYIVIWTWIQSKFARVPSESSCESYYTGI